MLIAIKVKISYEVISGHFLKVIDSAQMTKYTVYSPQHTAISRLKSCNI